MRYRMASGPCGGFGCGESKAKRFVIREPNVTFGDMAGLQGAQHFPHVFRTASIGKR
jgi:hypothetical protein